VLIVVLIMGIVLGMTGSLLGGFYNMFEVSEDQSSARMRAQDVFNILSTPIQNAGIGVPVPSKDLNFLEPAFTFKIDGGTPRTYGMSTWPAAISIAFGDKGKFDLSSGNQLRVIYGVPTGIKYIGGAISPDADVDPRDLKVSFVRQIGDKRVLSPVGPSVAIDPYYMTEIDASPANVLTSSLLAFPGTNMMPAAIYRSPDASLYQMGVYTRKLNYSLYGSNDIRTQNENTIRQNHDIFLLRGAWAYVDKDNTFCFLNVYDNSNMFRNDAPGGVPKETPPNSTNSAFSGFMIDGIAGIWFETPSADPWRYVQVDVLAEGDTLDEKRAASVEKLKDKWKDRGVTLKPGVYYEEFSRIFRTRNVQRASESVSGTSKAAAYLIRAVFVDSATSSEKSIETAIIQSMRE
jgi:hypothetical protein